MATAQAIWEQVRAKNSPGLSQHLDKLLKFLAPLANPHAWFLSGKPLGDACDQRSAELLENRILQEILEGVLSKEAASQWFRFLFDAIAIHKQGGADTYPTRLTELHPPPPSPFSPAIMSRRSEVERWRGALHKWISDSKAEQDDAQWLGAIALSAALHGALLDVRRLTMLIERVSLGNQPTVIGNFASYEFKVPYRGLGNHHLLRWHIDPLTEMLIARFRPRSVHSDSQTPSPVLIETVRLFLQENSVRRLHRPKTGAEFVDSCRTWWCEKATQAELNVATREVISHSLALRSWSRFTGVPFVDRAPREDSTSRTKSRQIEVEVAPEEFEAHQDDVRRLYPWLATAAQALDLQRKPDVITCIRKQMEQLTDEDVGKVYLSWLLKLLDGQSSSGDALALSTIRRRFLSTTPQLLKSMDGENPLDCLTLVLEDKYSEITSDPDPTLPIGDIADGIRDFHFFFHKETGKDLMHDEAAVLGDEHSLKPVDANVVSFDDYELAKKWLDEQPMPSEKRDVCKIIMMLAFKCGMRRMEMFGLRLCDIQTVRGLTCILRKHIQRRLKTESSRRNIPLHAFLSASERRLLVSWIQDRTTRVTASGQDFHAQAFIFAQFDPEDPKYWIRGITDTVRKALREVTGDDQLFLHHLRHAFGSWNYLRLHAPDFPEIIEHFPKLPLTQKALKSGAKLRLLLWRRAHVAHRSYGHAVAYLLGHSSPSMSFTHYIHTSDLVLAAFCRNDVHNISDSTWRSASGLGLTAAYKYLDVSVIELLQATRRQFFAEEILIKPDSKGKELRPRGRPKKAVLHSPGHWIGQATVLRVLDFHTIEALSPTEISLRVDLSEAEIHTILEQVGHLSSAVRLPVEVVSGLPKLSRPWKDAMEKSYSESLASQVAAMSIRAKQLCIEGIAIHLKNYDTDKHDVAFRGSGTLKDINRYVYFMKSLGASSENYSWLVRVQSKGTDPVKLPQWSEEIRGAWRPTQLRRIDPKVARSASSFASWLGIFPVKPDGDSLGRIMLITLFLACVGMPQSDFAVLQTLLD